MSFLDRFKPQPKYRNPDPAIRLAGIAELPDDAEHWGVIAELAASDEDVRVRRAAIERIDVVGYLARIARTEHDEALRRELADRLVAIANAPADSDGDAATALDGLSDQKQLRRDRQVVAARHGADRGARQDSRRRRCSAASRAMPSTRRSRSKRSARVTDPAELLAVATKTDHKDAGIWRSNGRGGGGLRRRASRAPRRYRRARKEQVRREARQSLDTGN